MFKCCTGCRRYCALGWAVMLLWNPVDAFKLFMGAQTVSYCQTCDALVAEQDSVRRIASWLAHRHCGSHHQRWDNMTPERARAAEGPFQEPLGQLVQIFQVRWRCATRRYGNHQVSAVPILMTKKAYPLSKVYGLLEPGPVTLLTTAHKGKANVMSWHTMMEFEPPWVGCVVSGRDFSFEALTATRPACH